MVIFGWPILVIHYFPFGAVSKYVNLTFCPKNDIIGNPYYIGQPHQFQFWTGMSFCMGSRQSNRRVAGLA